MYKVIKARNLAKLNLKIVSYGNTEFKCFLPARYSKGFADTISKIKKMDYLIFKIHLDGNNFTQLIFTTQNE